MNTSNSASLGDIADYIDNWLVTTKENNQNFWFVTDSEQRGLDLARLLFQKQFGEFSSTSVPFDTLPTYAANGATSNRAFIVVDTDELEEQGLLQTPAVLVTMHDEHATGDMKSKVLSPRESHYAKTMAAGAMTPPELAKFNPTVLDYLDNDSRTQDMKVRPPQVVMVDNVEPNWDRLTQNLGPQTLIVYTGRVQVKAPLKEEVISQLERAAQEAFNS